MNTKITFLGTAGDSMARAHNLRSSGGIVLEYGDDKYLIDPGPNSLSSMKKAGINPREIISVLISSNTLKAANDINAVIDAITYNGIDKTAVLVCPETLLNEESFLKKKYLNFFEKVIKLNSESKIAINDIEIKGCFAKNSETTIGFKFFTPYFTFSYLADTEFNNELKIAHKNSNILVINCKNPSGIKEKDSLNTDDVIKIVESVRPNLAIITSFGARMIKADPLYEARKIQRATGIQTLAASDGLVINPQVDSIGTKQKTMNSYP